MANVVRLRKANRVVTVQEMLAPGYLKRGYDQIDDNGNIMKHATGGKTVSIAEHVAVLKELEEIKTKAKEFAEKGKQLQEENQKLKERLSKK